MTISPFYECFHDLHSSLNDSPREWLDGLRRVGFRLNTGIDDTGFMLLVWSKAGGYHFGADSPYTSPGP